MAETEIKNLFLDANIWLSLFTFSSNDLEQFSKLQVLVKDDIHLYITEQVYNEVMRNRENKLKEALDKFEKMDLQFPVFIKNYEEYAEFSAKYAELKSEHGKWLSKIKQDIMAQNTPADKVLNEFFTKVEIIPTKPEIVQLGVQRYNIGDPPGKDKKYGDAISWETLLSVVPDGENLYFISEDRDYVSVLDKKAFNQFLANEWKSKKWSEIVFFPSLVEFIREHLQDIQLKVENEKEEMIENLRCSRSYSMTHLIIKQLNEYADWTEHQIEEICDAAKWNGQVGRILCDSDVYEFYSTLLSRKNRPENVEGIDYVQNELERIKAELEDEENSEFDLNSLDLSELPF